MKKRNLVLFGTVATLSLALAGSIGTVVASAADITNTQSDPKEVELTYTVAAKWTVAIPDSIEIGSGSGTGTVTAKDLVLNEGEHLKVTVSSDNSWKLQTTGGASIDYDVKIDSESIKADGVVLENLDGNSSSGDLSKELSVELTNPEEAKVAGDYTDTLTFTVEVA